MRLWNYFAGYVMIRVEGLSLEKFLNTAAELGVAVFDARRVSYTVLRALVSARGYKKLRSAVSDRYAVSVVKKAGVPIGLKWMTGRKALLVGLVLIAAATFLASLFVWEIRVSGLDYNEAKALKQELNELGLGAGSYKGDIDLKETEKALMLGHDEFAWINVRLRGVIADVEVVLAEPVPEIVDDTRPCNIVATKDAMVVSVTARQGRAAVDQGDTVRAGDVLISGMIWDAGLTRMQTAARGEVIGSVWYSAQASAPTHEQSRIPTGRTQQQRVIVIGADTADVDDACTFAEYDTRIIDTRYVVGLFLPVKILVLEHAEVELHDDPIDRQMLKVYLEERAYYDAAANSQADIVSHVAVFTEQDGQLAVMVYVQTYEDIGKVVYLEE